MFVRILVSLHMIFYLEMVTLKMALLSLRVNIREQLNHVHLVIHHPILQLQVQANQNLNVQQLTVIKNRKSLVQTVIPKVHLMVSKSV